MSTKLLKLLARTRLSLRRFPLTLLILSVFAIVLMVNNHNSEAFGPLTFSLITTFSPVAAILATACTLWLEERRATDALTWVCVLAVFTAWIYIAMDLALGTQWGTGHMMLYGSSLAFSLSLMLCASHAGKSDDRGLWVFASTLIRGGIIAAAISLALFLALALLIVTVQTLFFAGRGDNLIVDAVIISWVIVAPVLFLQAIPQGAAKRVEEPCRLSLFVDRATHLLFIPLLLIFLLVLYVYGFKILLQWELPRGVVSMPVACLVVASVALLLFFYPYSLQPQRRIDVLLRRWLPVAVLPLLVLMSVGISRRISDYGLTTQRLYGLTFNIWAYAACIYLMVRRLRMSWLPVSLSALMLVVSVGPWRYDKVIQRMFRSRIVTLVEQTKGPRLPMTSSACTAWYETLDSLQQEQFLSDARYLHRHYPSDELSDILSSDALYKLYSLSSPSRPVQRMEAVEAQEDSVAVIGTIETIDADDKPLGGLSTTSPDQLIRFTADRHDTISVHGYLYLKNYEQQNFSAVTDDHGTISIYLPDGETARISRDSLLTHSRRSRHSLHLSTRHAVFHAHRFVFSEQDCIITLSGVMLFKR